MTVFHAKRSILPFKQVEIIRKSNNVRVYSDNVLAIPRNLFGYDVIETEDHGKKL